MSVLLPSRLMHSGLNPVEEAAGAFATKMNRNRVASQPGCRRMRSRRAGIVVGTLAVLLWMAAAGQASVSFSPASLTFSAQAGGANPPAQTTQVVGVVGSSPPGIWRITVSTNSGGPWLSASPTSGQGPATVTVSVNIAGVPQGSYGGTLTVVESGGNTATASVTLQIASGITLTPSTLSFTGQAGGFNPPSQTVQLTSPPGVSAPPTWTVSISTSNNGNWLVASPLSGQGSGSITVSVNISGLAAGTYSGTLTVTAAGVGTATANVTLTVTLPPSIALSPSALIFSGQAGGTNPAPQTTLVSNPGGGGAPKSWNVTVATTSGGIWLSASPGSGSGTGNVTVTVDITGLAAGTYNGTVTVSETGVGSAVASVTLQLSGNTTTPIINAGGLVNGASFSKLPPAAASIASLFGTNFGTSVAVATKLPLPTELGGVSVIIKSVTTGQSAVAPKSVLPVGGINAPLFSVSPSQINFEIPVELADQTQATVAVILNGVIGNSITFNLTQYNPAIFAINQQGSGQGAILISSTGEVAAPSGSVPLAAARPAKRGEYITIYCTGLGPVTNQPADGTAASSNPLSVTTTNPTVKIGGNPAPATDGFFSGLAPNFVGLYQVNVQVPLSASTGDAVPLTLSIGGVDSNLVTIAVQ